MGYYKVIIKRPNELIGHMTWISGTLKNLQTLVKGHIETVTVSNDPKVIMIVNEDGKLKDLPTNFMMGFTPGFRDVIKGKVVLCGVDGEDFADIPITLQQWKEILRAWGNEVE